MIYYLNLKKMYVFVELCKLKDLKIYQKKKRKYLFIFMKMV